MDSIIRQISILVFHATVGGLALTTVHAHAAAQDGALDAHLELSSMGCLEAVDTTERVERLLARRVFASGARAQVVVQETARARSARVDFVRPGQGRVGTRILEQPDGRCDALQEAIALVIALMIDLPDQEQRLQLPSRPPVVPHAPSAAVAPGSAVVPQSDGSAPRALAPYQNASAIRGTMLVAGYSELGGIPELGGGALLEAGLSVDGDVPVSLGIRVDVRVPLLSIDDELNAVTYGLAAGLRGCLSTGAFLGSLRLEGCAVADAGWWQSEGGGFRSNLSAGAWRVSVGGSGRLAWELSPDVALVLSLGFRVPLSVPVVRFIDVNGAQQTLAEGAPVVGRAGLGLRISYDP